MGEEKEKSITSPGLSQTLGDGSISQLATEAEENRFEDDESRGGRILKLRHDDHWDKFTTVNAWTQRLPGSDDVLDWLNDLVDSDDASLSNEQLYEDLDVKTWLRRLASLSKQDLPGLQATHGTLIQSIPLFKDDNGDEYQLQFCWWSSLPSIYCPANSMGAAGALRQLQGRLPSSQATPQLPKFIFEIGYLAVRTTSRYADEDDDDDEDPETERTDYSVVLDVESDEMAVWLLGSQQQFTDREINPCQIKPLPIFQGLMYDEEIGHFDSACILSSIHQLGMQNTESPTAAEVYDLVRKTRGVRHPVICKTGHNQLEKLVNGQPLDQMAISVDLTDGTTLPEDSGPNMNSNP